MNPSQLKGSLRSLQEFCMEHLTPAQKADFNERFGETLSQLTAMLTKMQALQVKVVRIEHPQHTWCRDEDGEIDMFAWESDQHNGPVCSVCGESPCMHCNPDWDSLSPCVHYEYTCPVCGEVHQYRPSVCKKCGQALKGEP